MSKTAKHVVFSLLIAAISYWLSYQWQVITGTSDLYQRICAAREFLAGNDPYKVCILWYAPGKQTVEYMMMTILAFVPLAGLPYFHGAAAFWALSNGILAYGILRNGQPYHWLLFLSGQYFISFAWQQFSVIITAVMLLPSLLPLALLKPQIGLPVILTNLTYRRVIACAAFVALTFIVFPTWPVSWWERSSRYDGVIPILALPLGPLMLLALLRWRDKSSRFLFLFACIPQRFIYDLVPLFLLPSNLRQMLVLCILSWVPSILWMMQITKGQNEEVHLALVFTYLPLLAMQLAPDFREWILRRQATSPRI